MALKDDGSLQFDGKLALAANPKTPTDFLRLLATGDVEVRSRVARNPSTPLDLLTKLSKDKAKTVREAVVENTSAPDDLKEIALAITASARTRKPTVAERAETIWHEELEPSSLASYLSDKAMGIRIAAAIRGAELGLIEPHQCAELISKEASGRGASQLLDRWEATREDVILEVLLVGRFEDQLARIAQDPSSPVAVVRRLFDANIPGVAWYFATRDEVTPDELHALSTAPSHSFATWTEPHSPAVGQVYSDGHVTCYPQVVVALHDATRQDTLIQLRKARSKYVRAALAQRPDPDALPLLAKDKESVVRAAVAAQPATPIDLLEALAMDPERGVRAAVHANPSATDTARAAAALLGI
jgi:hypothetical protein